MSILVKLTVCLVLASLTACAPMVSKALIGPPVPCDNPGACQIYVEVMYCGANGLRVTPDHVGINGQKDIQWTIISTDYKFPPNGTSPSDGIVVNGSGFTPNPGVVGPGQRFIVNDNGSDHANPIKYSVHVVRQDGSECTRYDPYISNQ